MTRSLAAGKSNIPATAKSVNGKISVCWRPACSALFSSSEPGTADACAVKLSTSPIIITAKNAIKRIVPCIKIVGPSIMTEPIAALAEVKFRILSNERKAMKSVPRVSVSCKTARRLAAAKASSKTPITAPPRTINIGARNEYCRTGVSLMAISLPLLELDR
ncbi:unannotated protein [freshwater metagenome]|uniref:Unannotated protein n=1 Tax=freshwater metagenome TaxID=449393 RepID=A0A6J7LTK7_9ZZZZ